LGQYCAFGALATVFAIEFTMPVWTALLAAAFLGERQTQGRCGGALTASRWATSKR